MLARVWNEYQVNLTLENDEQDEWNAVLTPDNYIVKFNKSTLENQVTFRNRLPGQKYKFFTNTNEMFMIGEVGAKDPKSGRIGDPDNWVANLTSGTY